MKNEYLNLYEREIKILLLYLPLATFVKQFSEMSIIKNKFGNRESIYSFLRLNFRNLQPNIEDIIEQEHSH